MARYIAHNTRTIIRADRPQPDNRIRRLGHALPWWTTWIIPGAFLIKWAAPAALWLLWLTWTALITIPLAVTLAISFTVADWTIVRPLVLVLVAAGWTPPAATAGSWA
ncbi:MAG: hypothetical protein AAGK32_08870, partial [Actinomycetota bacterium]